MTGARGHWLPEEKESRDFFWLCCQESQFPSVGLMHCFISNSVGFAQEQLSETIPFNAEWNVFEERGFLCYFCCWWRRICLRKLLSLMHSDPAVKALVLLRSLYQILLYAPQTISGIFLSSKLLPLQKVSQKIHTLCCPGQKMLFLFFLLWYVSFWKQKQFGLMELTVCGQERVHGTESTGKLSGRGDPGFMLV